MDAREESALQTKRETARLLKQFGDPTEKIANVTGLLLDEIEQL